MMTESIILIRWTGSPGILSGCGCQNIERFVYNVWILHAEEGGIAGQRYSGCQNTARFVITFV